MRNWFELERSTHYRDEWQKGRSAVRTLEAALHGVQGILFEDEDFTVNVFSLADLVVRAYSVPEFKKDSSEETDEVYEMAKRIVAYGQQDDMYKGESAEAIEAQRLLREEN